jgi:hypothetical protein
LVKDSHIILARRRKHFSQLFHVHGVSDARQTEIRTVKPQVPEPSAFEVEMAIDKLTRHKSPGIDQLPAEIIKAGGRKYARNRSEIHKPINSIWKKGKLPEDWTGTSIVPAYKKGDQRDCSNYT